MKAYTIAAMTVVAGLASGCASTSGLDQKARMDAEQGFNADRMVQQRIDESTRSIASTLQLIESLERGPVGSMSAAPERQAAAVPGSAMGAPSRSLVPNAQGGSAAPKSAVSTSGEAMQTGSVDGMLEARLRIQWHNGSPEELLRTLAKQMGIPFKVTGERRALPPISVYSKNESMSWILDYVSKKVDSVADVVLNNSQQPAVLELRFK